MRARSSIGCLRWTLWVGGVEEEEERRVEYKKNVENLCLELNCSRQGGIRPWDYEAGKALMEIGRDEWDEPAMKGPCSFYEGAYSAYLS